MIYEEKKVIIINSILEATKLQASNKNLKLSLDKSALKQIEISEIINIITQFQKLGKLKVVNSNTKDPLPVFKKLFDDIGTPEKYLEVSVLDLEYFRNELRNLSPYDNVSKPSSKDTFFIEFSSDRRILLNGKIDLAKPDFGDTNEAIFKFLFDHPNQPFTRQEIEDKIRMKITQKFDKIVDNLGFKRGLRAAFFDISDKRATIKFKNPVTL